jgi:5'-3' exonuclease
MGIRHLNRFLRTNCSDDAIKYTHLSDLSGKKIAIDISIYIYKYEGDGTLIENIYLLLAIMRYYNIIPICIFDGKPPAEKKELLEKRKEEKTIAKDEYTKLKNKLENTESMDDDEKQEIVNNMDILKKKFIYITKEKYEKVKELIRAFGVSYYDAPGEADELCAMLTIKKKVWACMSEDMDMFVYGCPRVIRYLSLMNHTIVLYNTSQILNDLGLSQKEFREVCVISGTDYNINSDDDDCPNLPKTLKLFKKYHKTEKNKNFYDWLVDNTDYVSDVYTLKNVYEMFDLSNNHENLKIFDKIKIANGQIVKRDMKDILEEDGFIFMK